MKQSSNPDVPKILPPHLFFATVILMLALGFLETGQFGTYLTPLLLSLFGVWLAAREKNRFVAQGTSFYPGEDAHKLITEGAYRYSRNPMYLGMVFALLGLWPLTLGWTPAIPLVIFIGILEWRFIRPEEASLERLFGEDYLAYKRSVRRWL